MRHFIFFKGAIHTWFKEFFTKFLHIKRFNFPPSFRAMTSSFANDPKNPLYKKSVCKTCHQPLPKQLELTKSKLTQKEIDEFSECFQMFDKDGDGTIDVKELGAVLRSLGNNPTEEDVEEMVDDADEDGSGSINFPEFIALMLKRQQSGETKEEIKQVFRVFDKDGNGYVSTSELKFVMNRMGVNFTDDELNEMVMEADIDGDGQVCFEEFYNMMTAD